MSAADTSFDELWSRAAAICAEEAHAARVTARSRHQPAPNNIGVVLLIVALAFVLLAGAFVGVPALDKLRGQTSCATATTQVAPGTSCTG
jgi:hypothetical protein